GDRGIAEQPPVGARRAADRHGRDRVDGAQETRGLFLMDAPFEGGRRQGHPTAQERRGDPVEVRARSASLEGQPPPQDAPAVSVEIARASQTRDLLRFVACGSVDDGKSTLIGRLLAETGAVPVDQIEALKQWSRKFGSAGEKLDYALLLDGLEAE